MAAAESDLSNELFGSNNGSDSGGTSVIPGTALNGPVTKLVGMKQNFPEERSNMERSRSSAGFISNPKPSYSLCRYLSDESLPKGAETPSIIFEYKSEKVAHLREELKKLDLVDQPERIWCIPALGRASDPDSNIYVVGPNMSPLGEQHKNKLLFGDPPFEMGACVNAVFTCSWVDEHHQKQKGTQIFPATVASAYTVTVPEVGECCYKLSFASLTDSRLATFLSSLLWPLSRVTLRLKSPRKLFGKTDNPKVLKTAGYGTPDVPSIQHLPRGAIYVKGGHCYKVLVHDSVKNLVWSALCTATGVSKMGQTDSACHYYETLEPLTPETCKTMRDSLVAANNHNKMRTKIMRKLKKAMQDELAQANCTLQYVALPWITVEHWQHKEPERMIGALSHLLGSEEVRIESFKRRGRESMDLLLDACRPSPDDEVLRYGLAADISSDGSSVKSLHDSEGIAPCDSASGVEQKSPVETRKRVKMDATLKFKKPITPDKEEQIGSRRSSRSATMNMKFSSSGLAITRPLPVKRRPAAVKAAANRDKKLKQKQMAAANQDSQMDEPPKDNPPEAKATIGQGVEACTKAGKVGMRSVRRLITCPYLADAVIQAALMTNVPDSRDFSEIAKRMLRLVRDNAMSYFCQNKYKFQMQDRAGAP